MSTTVKLNSYGDIVFDEKHRIPVISEKEKILQDITILLKSSLGSLATDPAFGTDHTEMLAAKNNKTLMSSLIRSALTKYRNIKSVDNITISDTGKDRTAVISITATLTDDTFVQLNVTL